MSTLKNTITINGKVYDVNNGTVASSNSHSTATGKSKSKHIHPKHQVSDIIRPTSKPKVSHQAQPNKTHKQDTDKAHNPTQTKTTQYKKSSASINHAKRKITKTQTLARHYVQKPKVNKHSTTDWSKPAVSLRSNIDHGRLSRAKQVKRSHNVSRFGHSTHTSVTKKIEHLPVAKEPKHTRQHKSYDITDTPPHPTVHKQKTQQQRTKDIFESAINASTSHRQTYDHKKKGKKSATRKLSIVASSLTALLLIAFFVYQNVPTIALYTSSPKVGFSISKPGYQPAGFGLKGPVEYQSGRVVLNFRSNSDDRNYTIEQTKSNLDSASLLNDYLTSRQKDYATEFANGRTVYIYDNNNATWVDGGIWYKLSNNANLSSDQLIKIVSSI